MEKTPVIKLRNLKLKYKETEDYVLKGINVDIFPGQIIGYIGANGAGKTTTIKIILSLIDFYEGNVEIFGKDISLDKISYKYKIGYVPEGGELYESLTGYEMLDFFGKIYKVEPNILKNRIEQLSEIYGIKEALTERISSYSKGMKQKLLIISSLIHNPDILIYDEPLNGLDANSVQVFKEMISLFAKEGKTIFYSSHIMDVVEKISDRILLLNNGQIVADGTFSELQENSKLGSLEGIFSTLTGFNQAKEIASSIVEIIKG